MGLLNLIQRTMFVAYIGCSNVVDFCFGLEIAKTNFVEKKRTGF